MLRFLQKSRVLGIEITTSAVKAAMAAGRGAQRSIVSAARTDLSPGIISGIYSLPNIHDENALTQAIRNSIKSIPSGQSLPVALSLPDSVFRVQTLEFDELPKKNADRERLIRWRLEKTAAFDISDSLLQYQILRRQDAGFTILTCFAKKAVIGQYEKMLLNLEFEPWSIGLSSFHTLNLYAPYIAKKTKVSALTHVAEDSFTTIVSESGGARFYRFKDMKRGGAEELRSRMVREIDESLHFYSHMDRSQQSEVGHLYLTGEQGAGDLAAELKKVSGLEVELLTPSVVLPGISGAGPEMAAALGAGKTV
jgi:Tfp pilus assembly PilM family ATPase